MPTRCEAASACWVTRTRSTPTSPAAENLGFALRMIGRSFDPHAVKAALETVGLGAHADSRTRGFSAGMQRRLALARLRVLEPDLLLLDEAILQPRSRARSW